LLKEHPRNHFCQNLLHHDPTRHRPQPQAWAFQHSIESPDSSLVHFNAQIH
jgi:hypothetical protein